MRCIALQRAASQVRLRVRVRGRLCGGLCMCIAVSARVGACLVLQMAQMTGGPAATRGVARSAAPSSRPGLGLHNDVPTPPPPRPPPTLPKHTRTLSHPVRIRRCRTAQRSPRRRARRSPSPPRPASPKRRHANRAKPKVSRRLCGMGPPLPHLRRDGAHPRHICAGTGLTPAHICAGTGLTPAHICAGTALSLKRAHPRRRRSFA